MSGTESFLEQGGELTPEQRKAYFQGQLRPLALGSTALASSAITNLAPDPQLPGVLGYVPLAGMGERLIGFGKAVGDAAAAPFDALASATGLPVHPPQAPSWMETAARHAEETNAQIRSQIRSATGVAEADPNNIAEQVIQGAATGAGAMTPLAPASGLPGIARILLAPTSHVGLTTGVGAGLGATSAAVDEGLKALDAQDQGQPPRVQLAANDTPGVATDAPAPSFTDFMDKQQQPPTHVDDQGQEVAPSFADYLQQGGDHTPYPLAEGDRYSEHTWAGQILTYVGIGVALTAAAVTHRLSAGATIAERTARFNDPRYMSKAQDYNNHLIAQGGSDIDIAPVVAPLPEANRFRQATNYVNTKMLNEHAQTMDAIKMIADPSAAERMAHMYGNLHDDGANQNKINAFVETGHDPISGMTIPSLGDLYRKLGSMTDDQFKVWDRAKQSLNEMDNRRNNGGAPHDFKNQTDADLQNHIAIGRADPVVNDAIDFSKGVSDGMMDLGVARNFFLQQEGALLKARHPNYVSETGVDGQVLHPIGTRDTGSLTGKEQMNVPAHVSMAQHVEQLYHQFAVNDMNVQLRQTLLDAQNRFPTAAKFARDVSPPQGTGQSYFQGVGGETQEPIIRVRTASGPKYTRVDHPDFYNAMTSNSLLKNKLMQGVVVSMRKIYQRDTTGLIASVGGKAYALTNLGYSIPAMSFNAPKNFNSGILQQGMRNLTGSRYNSGVVRGLDLATNLGMVPAEYLQGVGDRWVGRLANDLKPGNNTYKNQALRTLMGDARVDALSKAMEGHWMRSTTQRLAGEYGIGGGLTQPYKLESPAIRMPTDKKIRIQSANVAPDVFFDGKWMGMKPTLLKLNNALQEAFNNIADAGHTSFARRNINNPFVSKEALTYETRALTGNPNTRGSSNFMQGMSAVNPFFNVSVQGVARAGRALGERPLNAPVSLVTGLGALALLEHYTHMRSKEHMDYFNNELSAQQKEGNVILGTNADPHKPMMIGIAQEYRLAHAVMRDFVGSMMNVVAAQHDPLTAQSIFKMMTDFFGGHIRQSTIDQEKHAIADAIPNILPPLAGQLDYSKMSALGLGDSTIQESYKPSIQGKAVGLPNQVQDGLLDDKEGKHWQSLFSAGFGAIASVIQNVNDATRYHAQTGDWWKSIGMAGHDWLYGSMDKNPQLNVLFEHTLRSSMQPQIVETTQRELDALDKIGGSRTASLAEGFTSKSRSALPVFPTSTEKLPTDQTMLQMYTLAEQYKNKLAVQRQDLTDMKLQMGSVQMQGMDPEKRRLWMNDATRKWTDKHYYVHATIADLDHELSQLAGVPMTIGKFARGDMSGTVDQFK